MQLRPRNNLTSGAFANIYRDTRKKGDKPREWSWRRPKKASPVTEVNLVAYMKEHT